MWLAIIILIIVGIVLFKIFDRDFIKAIPQKNGKYKLIFESGKEPICELVCTCLRNNKKYYVFIPVKSLNAIPDEDIIILKSIILWNSTVYCVFAQEIACNLCFFFIP